MKKKGFFGRHKTLVYFSSHLNDFTVVILMRKTKTVRQMLLIAIFVVVTRNFCKIFVSKILFLQ